MILFIYCLVFSFLGVQSIDELKPPVCKDPKQVYILEGRLVQLYLQTYYVAPYSGIIIEACKNSSEVKPKVLDLNLLLRNTARLELRGVAWPTLQEAPQLERVDMLDVRPTGVWGDCSKLTVLFIRAYSNKFITPPDWLENCTQLHSLILAKLTVAEVRTVVDSAPHVESVEIFALRDTMVSNLVNSLLISTDRGRHQWIKKFDVFGIERYDEEPDLPLKGNSQNKKINSWAEVSAALVRQLSVLPRLETSYINERNFDFCPTGEFQPVTFKTLHTLRLWSTGTSKFCFKKLRIMPQLQSLAVWYSETIKVQFSELYTAPAPELRISFEGIKIAYLEFVREDYLALWHFQTETPRKGNVTLSGLAMRIECDCSKTLWFARALQERLVTATGVVCSDSSSPENLSCEELSCKRVPCAGGCVCCSRGTRANTSLLADCRDAALTALSPALLSTPHLTTILAPHNQIHSLPDYMPDSLIKLDLSHNNIWQAGASAVKVLFAHPERNVRLAGNNIFCSCADKPLIIALQEYRDQIEDYQKLICAITGQKVAEVNSSSLCEVEERDAALLRQGEIILMTVPATLFIAAVLLVLGVVLYYKRREVQIFLFSRGWCLFCVQEDELDADRPYDIFLSFCHADTEVVLQNLLPILDSEYSVCVHLRDWCPGEVIPEQITKSVSQSRRTVVVLSRDFVKSIWGRLEFETAHVSGLMEGRVRVVMIVLDDVLEWEELPVDLKAYVRLNTYVKWGDPWFWEKLKYALPHRSTVVKRNCEQFVVESVPLQVDPSNREHSSLPHFDNMISDINV